MKQTYDRAAIMREANRLTKLGMPRKDATKAAWECAKRGGLRAYRQQQEAGIRAALKRYGIDADRVASLAQEAVAAIVHAVSPRHALLLPPQTADVLDLKKDANGVFRL
jgi:hypothetical protein